MSACATDRIPNRPAVLDYAGPVDWQILQQTDGAASFSLSGRLHLPPKSENAAAQFPIVRLVCEDTSSPVTAECGWRRAERFDAATGEFGHRIEGVPAGGLYRLEIGMAADARFLPFGILHVVHALGVGDLWVLAGQSNSAGIGSGLAYDPPELGVHLLANRERWQLAMHPLNDPTESFHPNVEGRALHSPNLAFAKALRRELGYPIGLIQTALGASPLSRWNPAEEGSLYRNMMHCIALAGGRVRGILWYQGCSDTQPEQSASYGERFAHFVRSVRRDLGDPGLPFITTQLNRVWEDKSPEVALGWSRIREVQRRLAGELERVAVVPTVGLPLCDGIHNSAAGNLELGARYAAAALGMVHGRPIVWRYPEPRSVRRSAPATIELDFAHVASTLQVITTQLRDFRVEDDEGPLGITGWSLSGRSLLSLTVDRPLASGARVSSCVGSRPDPSLFDFTEHRPALAFHEWPVE